MQTGISDIQKMPDNNIEITFCTYPNCEDYLTLTIDERTAWEIHDFCQKKLSYGAQLKNEKIKK